MEEKVIEVVDHNKIEFWDKEAHETLSCAELNWVLSPSMYLQKLQMKEKEDKTKQQQHNTEKVEEKVKTSNANFGERENRGDNKSSVKKKR